MLLLHPLPILGPAQDEMHVAERICTWWSIYYISRTISHTMSLPGGLPVLLYRVSVFSESQIPRFVALLERSQQSPL